MKENTCSPNKQGRKTASFHYPGGGAKYKGEAVQRSLVEPYTDPDSNETEWRENTDTVMNWFSKEDSDFVTLYYGEQDKKPKVTEILLTNYISFRDLVEFDIVDYGSFGMLLPKPGQEEAVYQALKNAHLHLNVYKREEFPERFHFAKYEWVLPIVMYADSGYNINGEIMALINVYMDMKIIFRAFGPDLKKNHLAEPSDSIHIYTLMWKLLGVTPVPHNGSLAVTQEMLIDAYDQQPGVIKKPPLRDW
ncbi:ectonucleotide pyrophosphatase/phosphodiesterase 7-like protein [Pontoporia blainvillei]|uniref:Ectonucleotide pyrophosphatase/phosphodiesterase 7-like protein n=1 Tax=Pontoporia blainvillei TaxID=48723 RepID=A0ABX0S233_PONBL|nr:ectonucleotide pyrophosphatase/phosphodiesterase 7-like protein [Pontoporia blainvillei]